MSEQPSVLATREGAVCYLTLNHPERLNAISYEDHGQLWEALDRAGKDDAIKVVVLRGAGRSFCAGDFIKAHDQGGWPARLRHRQVDLDVGAGPTLLNEVTAAFWRFPKATIALMHGHAVGAGYDLASSCDFRLATHGCKIGDPRVKLGLWGAEVWSYKLPRLIGQTRVPSITWTGDLISGDEARDIGFVHRTYPDDRPLAETAQEFIDFIATLDAETYRAIKRDLRRSLDSRADQVFEVAA